MTNKIFPVTGPPSETHGPKVGVLEPPLVSSHFVVASKCQVHILRDNISLKSV